MDYCLSLLRLALDGTQPDLSALPAPGPERDAEWTAILARCCEHQIEAIVYRGLKLLPKEALPSFNVLGSWKTRSERTAIISEGADKVAKDYLFTLEGCGLKACVLKGVTFARLWPDPSARPSNDIDIWAFGGREKVMSALSGKGITTGNVLSHECTALLGPLPCDIHFVPSKCDNPVLNARYKRFFSNWENSGSTPSSSMEFNLVYCLSHCYRHLLRNGLNLKQVLDCLFILKACTPEERQQAADDIKRLGMARFAGELGWVLHNVFGLEESLLPTGMRNSGKRLLSEILSYSINSIGHKDRRLIHYLTIYPREILWSPPARLRHFLWRRFR